LVIQICVWRRNWT